ncbi:MAG: FAD-dependent thymidylate synthase [Candidatus Omnitrophica bacterium]|nr:FAD-dependent thymidylate synthase [Candidatus Omnitrophota bacterium]
MTSEEPKVTLVNSFLQPFNNAVATARTCYSSKVITTEDVTKDEKAVALRDKIAESIYQAGHHTTIQHSTFQFILEKVSRQFLWSFLHSHPFYNSEQVSQRYVEVKPGNFFIPPMADRPRELYLAAMNRQMDVYHELIELLRPNAERAYFDIFPARRKASEKWRGTIKKKVQEVARYILPVSTHAHLYHTISGITLHRYNKLKDSFDTPYETKLVVSKMVDAVNQVDPLFFRNIEDPMPLEQTLEYKLFDSFLKGNRDNLSSDFIKEFDEDLGNHVSKLVDYKVNAEKTMAQGVRTVLGLTKDELNDETAIGLVMDPATNPYYKEPLNLTTLSKIARVMFHPHYTFKKKLSHTADSQDQRHRMTPGSRPILFAHFQVDEPDYITPPLIKNNEHAIELYQKTMGFIWENINRVMALGVKPEFAMYALPNAFPIRFEESGDLLNLHHKWTTRLCYTAQEEIWNMCLDEVKQVAKIHPKIAEHLLPPCGLRARGDARPICPEGDRYCGIPVWKLDRSEYVRKL